MIQERLGRAPDFVVKYRFISAAEGGRRTGPPFQGYRCDWLYAEDDERRDSLYMIWPEFLDQHGNVLGDGAAVQVSGTANMWIVNPKLKDEVHRERIRLGTKGYFMEGSKKVAEAEVVVPIAQNQ